MKFFDRIKLLFSSNFEQYIKDFNQGNDIVTTNASGMTYSAVFACFRVLAETFASVPIFEYKKLDDGEREQTDDTGYFDILHGVANSEMSSYNFKESSMYQQCAGGNAISIRETNRFNGTAGLYPLEWNRVYVFRDKETRKLMYRVDGTDVYTRDQVVHVPGPSMDGVMGMSILEYAAQSIMLGKNYDNYGVSFYKNGVMSSGIFEHPQAVKDTAFERLREEIKKNYQGLKNAGVPMILEDGMKFHELTIKPIDAQFLESRKFGVEEICRFCRVPLHLVQNLDKATNNNIEHQSLEFAMYTMLPHFKRFEEAYNTQLLSRNQRSNGYYFEFNMASLLRGDSASMANSFMMGRQWGWLSVNDIRRMLNLPKIPNGDIYLQPMNMVEAGKEPEQIENNGVIPDDTVKREIEDLVNMSLGGRKNGKMV